VTSREFESLGRSSPYIMSEQSHFSLSTSKWFGDDLSNVGGRVLSLEANTEYRLLDNLGVGIGYRYFDFSIGAATSDLRGGIGYRISAPMAFVRASF
jgi:opacity protein-like surface antigen